ncbi:hypothetical protein [Acuticoccus yangtzensis]|uniref:hypothetical protein n=1 Tax=Acuticoccus yangtzensis TaxID=1443441 RepID=UPI0009497DCC|nr:hypothetical protein [Acuticoccus yangtzensis]ORE96690.1 hypothetical protein ATO13_07490 [Stappia sp. 22II-S9-Z10]
MRESMTADALAAIGAYGMAGIAGIAVAALLLALFAPRFLALILFGAFLFILIDFVPRLDLGLVLGATALLAAYDLFIHRSPAGH